MRQPSSGSSAARPGALRALLAIAGLTALLVLAQAGLAGQFLNLTNTNGNIQKIHGYLGNTVFLLALAQVVLVIVSGVTGSLRSGLLAMTLTLVVLITAQLGLGYSGRERDNVAASLHIPNGVLIFGVTMANISMALRAIRETE